MASEGSDSPTSIQSRQTGAVLRTPADLINPRDYLKHKPNNYHVDFNDLLRIDPVIIEVLRGHPLAYALSAHEEIPEVYVQQLWHTMALVKEGRRTFISAEIDSTEIRISPGVLRRILHLPLRNHYENEDAYAEMVPESQVFEGIRQLGYTGPLTKMRDFKRTYLQGHWWTFFSFLNRCLTGKATGTDTASISLLRIFHAFAFNIHVDYAALIWNDLVEVIADKARASKARTFIPYVRFIQLIGAMAMVENEDIPRRETLPKGPNNALRYFLSHNDQPHPDHLPMTIPLNLLTNADLTVDAVREYIGEHYPDFELPAAEAEGSENGSDDSPSPPHSPERPRRTKHRHDAPAPSPAPSPPRQPTPAPSPPPSPPRQPTPAPSPTRQPTPPPSPLPQPSPQPSPPRQPTPPPPPPKQPTPPTSSPPHPSSPIHISSPLPSSSPLPRCSDTALSSVAPSPSSSCYSDSSKNTEEVGCRF